MDHSTLEEGIAAPLRALLHEAGLDHPVRPGSSAEQLSSLDPYVLVAVQSSEREAGDYWAATVLCAVVSPLLGPPADPVHHALAVATVEQLFRCTSFPLLAAGIWDETGHILHGSHVTNTDRYREDGKLVEGPSVTLGVQVSGVGMIDPDGGELPVPLAQIAAATGVPANANGGCCLVDARHGGPVALTLPAGDLQVAVALIGDFAVDGDDYGAWLNAAGDGPWPETTLDIPEGAVVVFSHGAGVPVSAPGTGTVGGLPGQPRLEILGTFEAAANISGTRFVHLTGAGLIVHADAALGREANGFVLSSALTGETATVYREGPLTGLSGLTTGQELWLGLDGEWETSPTLAGRQLTQQLGTATSATAAAIQLEPPTPID